MTTKYHAAGHAPIADECLAAVKRLERQREKIMKTTYEFSANGLVFGDYSGATIDEAKEAFAKDAGYTSWAAMVEQAEENGGNNVEIRECLGNGRRELIDD